MSSITAHGKQRLKERVEKEGRDLAYIRTVLNQGMGKNFFTGEFHKYLESKERRTSRVKVYRGNIYVFPKNSKRLITTYHIPEKFLPIENYMLNNKAEALLINSKMILEKMIKVHLNDGTILSGVVSSVTYTPEEKSLTLLDIEGNIHMISLESIKSIDLEGLYSK